MAYEPASSSPRLRRLHADMAAMRDLAHASELIRFAAAGNPPDRYVVTFACRGLVWLPATQGGVSAEPTGTPPSAIEPVISTHHEGEFYLHRDYPRRPPQIIWHTPIFHPNILSPADGGGVCIGGWTPSEALSDLILRVGEMIQFRSYNPDDVLNPLAAAWAEAHAARLPVDDRPLAVYVA
jgi:hypothetical protein